MPRFRISRLARLCALPLIALLLASCAAQMAYREGQDLVAQDKVEAGLLKLQEASARDPANAQYRAAWIQTRDRAATRLLDQAERALQQGKRELAEADYKRVLAIDPANERGRAGLRLIEMDARHTTWMQEAKAAIGKKEYEVARQRVAAILTERPTYEPARQLQNDINDLTTPPPTEAGLAAAYKQPITIEFRDAPLRQVFEVVSRRSGLNFLFDKDVKTDQKTSIFLKNSTVEAALYYLLVTNQLEEQVMDNNTILIFPNVAAKLKDYQEQMVKTFFIANADAKTVANTLKTILKSRDVVVDEKLNLVIMRDSPEAIKLASRLVALQDVAEPEVMLEVEILEVKRSRLTELGVSWPTAVGFAPIESASGPVTLNDLRGLNGSTIGVTGVTAAIKASKTDGDTNLLANPRIRVRNKEKAKIVIGQKIPNITTTISPGSGGFASESVNYVDVGLTLNVEPTIYLNNEVAIRVGLEVSNITDKQTTKSGTTAYELGTRQATTLLQLKDGENQVLAGLINNEERSSGTHVPGLGDIPLLGRLFGSVQDDHEKTEIVLSITPHLVRSVQRPPAASSEFSAGTETSFRRHPDLSARPAAAPAHVQPGQTGIVGGRPPGYIPPEPLPVAPVQIQPPQPGQDQLVPAGPVPPPPPPPQLPQPYQQGQPPTPTKD